MSKKWKRILTILLVLVCLSHLPYIKGSYEYGTPYHPFRVFSLEADEITEVALTNGYGDFMILDDEKDIQAYCDQLNSFRYILFIPDFLPARGHGGNSIRLWYQDDGYQWVYVSPGCYYRSKAGWYLGFGGETRDIVKTIEMIDRESNRG